MNKFENQSFTALVTDVNLTITVPVEVLVTAFEHNPVNSGELKLKSGREHDFALFVAKHIIEECGSETGDTPITKAIDSVFDLLIEGYEDGSEFLEEI